MNKKTVDLDGPFAAVLRARVAVLEAGAKPGTAGETECPVCKGTLVWRMASNKHIHARCETVGCVAWME